MITGTQVRLQVEQTSLHVGMQQIKLQSRVSWRTC